MMGAPSVGYAKSDEVHVAYQVVGDGPVDLLVIPGFVTHQELLWEDPGYSTFLGLLGEFSRVMLFDKRGTGLSDRPAADSMPSLEVRMDDARAVMDAAGSEQAFVLGISEGGPMSMLFAATFPERVRGLVVYGSTPRVLVGDGWPWGVDRATFDAFTEMMVEGWGTGVSATLMSGDAAEERREFMGRWERQGCSPGGYRTLNELFAEVDVRGVLPAIGVPTLIVHRDSDIIPMEAARATAQQISNARLVELVGPHSPAVDPQSIVAPIQEFVTGGPAPVRVDRVLATVLFTDIVASTEWAAKVGDRRWRELLDRHDACVRSEFARYLGREVKTTGDGFLAAFDGPARAIRCALAVRDAVQSFGLEIRAGLHTGECEARGDDLGGIAVHIGARVAAAAGPGEVLVSRTVADLVAGSGLSFEDRGEQELKGVPGSWRLFAATGC